MWGATLSRFVMLCTTLQPICDGYGFSFFLFFLLKLGNSKGMDQPSSNTMLWLLSDCGREKRKVEAKQGFNVVGPYTHSGKPLIAIEVFITMAQCRVYIVGNCRLTLGLVCLLYKYMGLH